MSLPGLKPPPPLNLEDNLALNWEAWINSYELYAGASGLIGKGEKVQCCAFLHIAGLEAQKLYRTFQIESADKDKIAPMIEIFRQYCSGKANITVVRYLFNSHNQTDENMESYIRELRTRISFCE